MPVKLLGLALLTLSWDKNWDSHSLVNGYPSFYPRIALVAPSPERLGISKPESKRIRDVMGIPLSLINIVTSSLEMIRDRFRCEQWHQISQGVAISKTIGSSNFELKQIVIALTTLS